MYYSSQPASLASRVGNVDQFLQELPPVIKLGIKPLDELIDTIAGRYIVLYGQPGVGKTDMLTTVTRSMLAKGFPVVYLSLELGIHPIAWRMVNALEFDMALNSHGELLESPSTPEHANDIYSLAVEEFTSYSDRLFPLDGAETNGETLFVEGVIAQVEAILASYGVPPIVAIDYFQLLRRESDKGTSTETYDATSADLAALAHRCGCCVLVASSVTDRNEPRGTRQILFDADIAFKMKGSPGRTPTNQFCRPIRQGLNVEVVKNRYGASGASVQLSYVPAFHHIS